MKVTEQLLEALKTISDIDWPQALRSAVETSDPGSLAESLGRTYPAYHAHLVLQHARVGPEPDPSAFRETGDLMQGLRAYTQAVDAVHAVYRAETTLRRLRAAVQHGLAFDEATLEHPARRDEPPMVDGAGRLYDVVLAAPKPLPVTISETPPDPGGKFRSTWPFDLPR